ncbi:hypothetical protein C8Q79DRAFT_124601 [Trametes meyenii]|nr:hypothetical protein C8Q79DRAFT_124601 [Trametes meyenii]
MAFLTQPAKERTTHLLGSVIGYLEGRTTSKAEDETIATSGLVNVSPRDILTHQSGEERMKKFLLLFEGFRWAPRTLARIGKLESERDELAICTPVALKGEYACLLLRRRYWAGVGPQWDALPCQGWREQLRVRYGARHRPLSGVTVTLQCCHAP